MQQFGVKALAEYTGINAHTLRVWERRFGVVKPARSTNGRRVYSQADAEKLCLIAALTAKGHAISYLAGLSVAELEKMVAASKKGGGKPKGTKGQEGAATDKVNAMLLDRMTAALEGFRLAEISAQLAMARMHATVADFIYEIILPLIGRIGLLVEQDHFSVAHEHALSAILKTHIYHAIYQLNATQLPPAVDGERLVPSITMATQEGDHHEFGILLALLLAASRGLTTHFFGANMPAKALALAANALRSPIVLVGRTIPSALSSSGAVITQREYLKELDQSLLASTDIWLGGLLEANGTKFRPRHRLTHIPSLSELDRRFAEMAGDAFA